MPEFITFAFGIYVAQFLNSNKENFLQSESLLILKLLLNFETKFSPGIFCEFKSFSDIHRLVFLASLK